MKTQSAKAKGRRLQQHVASLLLETFPELTEDDVRSTSMGAQGEDIQLSPKARSFIPYSIECKNQERVNVWESIQQSITNSKGYTPIVVIKKNNTQPHVVISLKEFVNLIAKKTEKMEEEPQPIKNEEIILHLEQIIQTLKQ